jgi:hypothetical protein
MADHLSLGQCARMMVLPRLVILSSMKPTLKANPVCLSCGFDNVVISMKIAKKLHGAA